MHKIRGRFRQSLKGSCQSFVAAEYPLLCVSFLFPFSFFFFFPFFLFFFFKRIIVHNWKTIAVWYIQWFWLVESNMGLKYWRIWKHIPPLFCPLRTPYSIWSRAVRSVNLLQSQTTVHSWVFHRDPEIPPEAWVGCVSSNYLNCAETEKLKEIRENGSITGSFFFLLFQFSISIFTKLHFKGSGYPLFMICSSPHGSLIISCPLQPLLSAATAFPMKKKKKNSFV